jgi:hypothetical protein
MPYSKIKHQSFGGVYLQKGDVSPNVPIGRDEKRKESKMYNMRLNFDQVLRMQHALDKAATYLSQFREDVKEHKNGVRLVVNFETGRVDVQRP